MRDGKVVCKIDGCDKPAWTSQGYCLESSRTRENCISNEECTRARFRLHVFLHQIPAGSGEAWLTSSPLPALFKSMEESR